MHSNPSGFDKLKNALHSPAYSRITWWLAGGLRAAFTLFPLIHSYSQPFHNVVHVLLKRSQEYHRQFVCFKMSNCKRSFHITNRRGIRLNEKLTEWIDRHDQRQQRSECVYSMRSPPSQRVWPSECVWQKSLIGAVSWEKRCFCVWLQCWGKKNQKRKKDSFLTNMLLILRKNPTTQTLPIFMFLEKDYLLLCAFRKWYIIFWYANSSLLEPNGYIQYQTHRRYKVFTSRSVIATIMDVDDPVNFSLIWWEISLLNQDRQQMYRCRSRTWHHEMTSHPC